MAKSARFPLSTGLLVLAAMTPWTVAAQSPACDLINYSCEAATSDVIARAGRATVMLRIPNGSQCTGTLVNNGRNDDRPFILTARHCAGLGLLTEPAGGIEITWGLEAPCSDAAGIPPVTTTGAIHRATYQDAWLIEALDAPPPAADPYFAGLNATRQIGSMYFGVHHGNGRAKQYVEQQVASGNIQYLISGLLGLIASTWHTNLIRGSTPFGSSGSALFDGSARVFGTLSVGAICAGDLLGNEYEQLDAAWDGGSADNSLSPWLDPDHVGFRQLAGRWPGQVPTAPDGSGGGGSDGGSGGGGGGALAGSTVWVLGAALLLQLILRRRPSGYTARPERHHRRACQSPANPCLPFSTPSSIR